MKIKNIILLNCCLSLFIRFNLLNAQEHCIPKNTVHFQIGGSNLFTGLNYEKKILSKYPVYANVGLGIYGVKPSYLTITAGTQYLIAIGKNFF